MKLIKFVLIIISILKVLSNAQNTVNLSGVIFDQSPSRNPDFEIELYCCGDNPVYNQGNLEIHNSSTFYSWFHPVSGVNIAIPVVLQLVEDSNGVYKYQSSNFFPIDGQGFDNITNYPNEMHYMGENNQYHNFHFCLRFHYSFTYRGGEYFNFTGDDDVWVFFNKKLAIDIGGIHIAESRIVYLDQLDLTRGQTYPWDFFYCERHTTLSTISIETNLIFKCAYYDSCNVCQGHNTTCCFSDKCRSISNPCQLYTCSEETDYTCKETVGDCNNGDLCANYQCITGVGCQFTNDKCDDNDPCTLDNCDTDTGECSHTAVSCDDHNICTNDSCDSDSGKCVHKQISCDDNNACTDDFCYPSPVGCVNIPINCLDGLACTADTCDNSTGCIHTQRPNCTECHDRNIEQCTTDDLCFPKICNPLNQSECITQAISCSIESTECIKSECKQGVCVVTFTCEIPTHSPTASHNTSRTHYNTTHHQHHNHTLSPTNHSNTPTVSITQAPTQTPTGTPLPPPPPPHTYHPYDKIPKNLLKSCLHCEDLNCKSQLSDYGEMASCTYVKNDLYDDDNDCDNCCLWIPTCYFNSLM